MSAIPARAGQSGAWPSFLVLLHVSEGLPGCPTLGAGAWAQRPSGRGGGRVLGGPAGEGGAGTHQTLGTSSEPVAKRRLSPCGAWLWNRGVFPLPVESLQFPGGPDFAQGHGRLPSRPLLSPPVLLSSRSSLSTLPPSCPAFNSAFGANTVC